MKTKQRTVIHPYKAGSRSSAMLKEHLGALQVRVDGKSRYRPRETDVMINWGASKSFIGDTTPSVVLNPFNCVATAVNKLTFFRKLDSTSLTVPYTESKEQAQEWVDDGKIVVARTVLNGHSGEGIVICDEGVDIPDSSLYTMYVPKKSEFRVHVVGDKIIRTQKKILRPEISEELRQGTRDKSEINWGVRNLDNGFIYNSLETEVPTQVQEVAVESIRRTGLDFGAVDVLFNEKRGAAFVLEINCAPGLTEDTCGAYVAAFKEYKGRPTPVYDIYEERLYEHFRYAAFGPGTVKSCYNSIILDGKLLETTSWARSAEIMENYLPSVGSFQPGGVEGAGGSMWGDLPEAVKKFYRTLFAAFDLDLSQLPD